MMQIVCLSGTLRLEPQWFGSTGVSVQASCKRHGASVHRNHKAYHRWGEGGTGGGGGGGRTEVVERY